MMLLLDNLQIEFHQRRGNLRGKVTHQILSPNLIKKACKPLDMLNCVLYKVKRRVYLMNSIPQFKCRYTKLMAYSYLLPNIKDMLDWLPREKYLTITDLYTTYWQTEMEKEWKPKNAFNMHMGFFECNIIPFGLCNALEPFQILVA